MGGGLGAGLSEFRALAAPGTQLALTMLALVNCPPLEIRPQYLPPASVSHLWVSLGASVSVRPSFFSLQAHPAPGPRGSHREVLEQPGSHDVGGHLGEDPPLLVPPRLLVQLLVLSPGTGGGHACVQPIS